MIGGGINYGILNEMVWKDLGVISDKPKKYSNPEIKENFAKCWLRDCCAYMNGKLYRCTRSYGLVNNIGINLEEECIDFDKINTKKELKTCLKEFYGLEYLTACYWCNDIKQRKDIKAGIQLKEGLE